jgi:hypothetical protein
MDDFDDRIRARLVVLAEVAARDDPSLVSALPIARARTRSRAPIGPALAAIAVIATILVGLRLIRQPAAVPTPSATPMTQPTGRSVCPGAVPRVETILSGPIADTLEQLQGDYEQDAGFLAVVFDGTKPVVIVEAGRLGEWRTRLAPRGVAVAPSCIDPSLLAAVQAALLTIQRVWIVSAGYDALDDCISVLGVDQATLVSTLEKQSPGTGSAALDAIAQGTLRINPAKIQETP